MVARALEAGLPFAWFTADEVYGQAKWLRSWLEDRGVSYVMAIRRSDTFTMPVGERRADMLPTALPARSWQKMSVGAGAHGPREYHWARVPVPADRERGRDRWLLARRSLSDPEEISYYACYGPAAAAPPTWPGPPGAAGASRSASSRPRARPGSTTTRSAPGGPGTPTSPCRCSPWPGSPSVVPRPKKGDRDQRPGHDRLHVSGDPPPARQPCPVPRTRPRHDLVLVPLAPETPVPGPDVPLPATRPRAHVTGLKAGAWLMADWRRELVPACPAAA
jgi:hypothetical protein